MTEYCLPAAACDESEACANVTSTAGRLRDEDAADWKGEAAIMERMRGVQLPD
jgi:hypothetical protein